MYDIASPPCIYWNSGWDSRYARSFSRARYRCEMAFFWSLGISAYLPGEEIDVQTSISPSKHSRKTCPVSLEDGVPAKIRWPSRRDYRPFCSTLEENRLGTCDACMGQRSKRRIVGSSDQGPKRTRRCTEPRLLVCGSHQEDGSDLQRICKCRLESRWLETPCRRVRLPGENA